MTIQLTQQSRIYPTIEQQIQLGNAFEKVGRFYRFCFNNFWFKGKEIERKFLTPLELKKKSFCSEFGIGTKQANCLIKEAQAKVILFQEMLCFTCFNLEKKLEITQKEIEKAENLLTNIRQIKEESLKSLKSSKTLNSFLTLKSSRINSFLSLTNYLKADLKTQRKIYQELKQFLWKKKRRAERFQSKIQQLKTNPNITFGSKTAQRKLSKKKMTLELWRAQRNNFIYGLGESDVSFGNNIIKILSQNKIQVELLNLDKIIIESQLRDKHFAAIEKETKRTARIVRKVVYKKSQQKIIHKYYLQSTIDYSKQEAELNKAFEETKSKSNSNSHTQDLITVGIDLNQGFFSVYAEDKNKNLSFEKNYQYDANFVQYNTGQRENCLRNLISTLFKELFQYFDLDNTENEKIKGVVRIEDLSFKTKKLHHLGKKMNKMLHDFPTLKFRSLMETYAFKNRMRLELINPAYSSQKAIKQGLDRHLGAARIIAKGNQ